MDKVLLSFFVGLTYVGRALKQPAVWAVLVILTGLWLWKHRHTEAGKAVNKFPPIEFQADAPPAPRPEGAGTPDAPAAGSAAPAVAFTPEAAANPDSKPVDPEKIPVMSSRALEVAVGRFHKDNLRLPKDVDELIEKKYLVGVPPAPPGKRYVLDLSPIQMRLVSK